MYNAIILYSSLLLCTLNHLKIHLFGEKWVLLLNIVHITYDSIHNIDTVFLANVYNLITPSRYSRIHLLQNLINPLSSLPYYFVVLIHN